MWLTTEFHISWCWERLKAGGEGDSRGQGVWMASLTQWTWVWAALGEGEGQGSLACCSPRGRKELAMTERLNHTYHPEVLRAFFIICTHSAMWSHNHTYRPHFFWAKDTCFLQEQMTWLATLDVSDSNLSSLCLLISFTLELNSNAWHWQSFT